MGANTLLHPRVFIQLIGCGPLSELIGSVELIFLRCADNTVTRMPAEHIQMNVGRYIDTHLASHSISLCPD
jgi:hypothetical protein